jgi:hypothetical protein
MKRIFAALFLSAVTPLSITVYAQNAGSALDGFYCYTATPAVGAATDICTVKLNSVAASGGTIVSLSSSGAAVTVPATVTVAANAASGEFTANVAAVPTAQTITLTASTGGVSETVALQLSAAIGALGISTTSVAFEDVALNTPATQPVTLTSSGSAPVTINSATATGTGFTVSGASFPLTLNPGQKATLSVQFQPTVAGAATGLLTIISNSTTNSVQSISLSGSGGSPALSAFYCYTGTLPAGATTDICTIKLNSVSASSPTTVSLSSSNTAVTLPATVTLAANVASAQFTASVAPIRTAQTITLTANTGGVYKTLSLQLSAATGPALSAFYCSTASVLGSATEVCTIKLNAVSGGGGTTVSLASSGSAVTVPATVGVAANAASAQFTANVASVETAQTITLTASAGGVLETFALQLAAAIQTLTASRTSMVFADVVVNTAATQYLTLSSTGTEPVTITTASLIGTGFTMSGAGFPLTLSPGAAATVAVQFRPTTLGTAAGQITVSSNSSNSGTTVIGLSGLTVAGPNATGQAGSFAYAGSSLVNTFVPPQPFAAIPRNLFGLTIFNLAPNSPHPQPNMTPFPTFPVSISRLLDVADWPVIDSYEGQNNWTKLDNSIAIAQQSGTSDFIYTFGRDPVWASTSPTDPCTGGEGPGTCAPPDMTAFDSFVTQVAQRYCGTIKYYEPWNEPDNPQFWDGDNARMLTIAQQVYQIVKDPANCGCTNGSCSPNGGVNPNQVLLPPISNTSSASISWLNSYLAAAGTPYPYADIAAFHGYVWSGYPLEEIVQGVQLLRQTLATYGLSNLPLWNTEASWELNTNIDQDQQASWVMRYSATQVALGISRFIEFSYDNCYWGTLWSSPLCSDPEGTMGQLTEAGNAYDTIENWFIGANLTQCEQYQNGLWTCELQRAGNYDAWMLWSSTGASIPVPVPANLGLTVYRDWQNNEAALPAQITVNQMPVLLETSEL